MKSVRNLLIALGILALGALACGGQTTNSDERFAFWTVTPNATSTPLVVVHTSTPLPTYTPNEPTVIVLTQAPNELGTLCVSALVAVHLRPSPNAVNYPIAPVPNGEKVTDLGGRNGQWIFVQYGDKQGWVFRDYLTQCQ